MELLTLLKEAHSPKEIEIGELKELQRLLYEYPYFQIGYTLLTMKGGNLSLSNKSIQKNSVYITDLDFFKKNLNSVRPLPYDPTRDQPIAQPQQKTNFEANRRPSTEESLQTKHFINEYIDDIYKRPPVTKENGKNALQKYAIDNYISKAINSAGTLPNEFNTKFFDEDLHLIDKLIFSDEVVTENLAKILLDQNKVESALGVYERIMINCPNRRIELQPIVDSLKEKL